MEITIGFVISRSSNGKFGVSVVARDAQGARLAKPVSFIDALFSSAAEAGDALLGTIRGTVANKRGAFERDELGIGNAP